MTSVAAKLLARHSATSVETVERSHTLISNYYRPAAISSVLPSLPTPWLMPRSTMAHGKFIVASFLREPPSFILSMSYTMILFRLMPEFHWIMIAFSLSVSMRFIIDEFQRASNVDA